MSDASGRHTAALADRSASARVAAGPADAVMSESRLAPQEDADADR